MVAPLKISSDRASACSLSVKSAEISKMKDARVLVSLCDSDAVCVNLLKSPTVEGKVMKIAVKVLRTSR